MSERKQVNVGLIGLGLVIIAIGFQVSGWEGWWARLLYGAFHGAGWFLMGYSYAEHRLRRLVEHRVAKKADRKIRITIATIGE